MGEGWTMSEIRQTIMTSKEIELAIKRIGMQILELHHSRDTLAIVGIYTCGVFLARRIHAFLEAQTGKEISFGSLDINLYRDDWSLVSQNPVVKTTDIPFDVDNSQIILVDDVLFTGRTIRAAMEAVMDYGRPDIIQLAILFDRGGRELPIQPDYVGMQTTIEGHQKIKVLMEDGTTGPYGGEVLIEG